MHDKPIGVFDSGVGGLTVMRALMEALPAEATLYLGDTARLPYGTKSAATVYQFARQCLLFLQTTRPKLLVVACNTASALALEQLRSDFSVPVIGVTSASARAHGSKDHARYHLYRIERTDAGWEVEIEVRGVAPSLDRFVVENRFLQPVPA